MVDFKFYLLSQELCVSKHFVKKKLQIIFVDFEDYSKVY